MNELKNVLNKINKNINKKVTNFVYYNNSGSIVKITNAFYDEIGLDCVEVPHEDVENIITGKHKFSDYVVLYDRDSKSFKVKQRKQSLYTSELLYKLPKQVFTRDEFENIYSMETKNMSPADKPIYEDIFVDVWYNELEHLPGQHIWYNKTVYRIKEYQEANTGFFQDNVEKILSDVKLFDDKNNELYFDKHLLNNDIFLSNNKLYMYKNNYIILNDIDLLVIQDIGNKIWKIILSNHVKQNIIKSQKISSNQILTLGITEENDPTILYKSLQINYNELIISNTIQIPFEHSWENRYTDIGIYAERFFDSYFYGVIYE